MKNWEIDTALHEIILDRAEQLYQEGAYERVVALAAKLAHQESNDYIGYLSSVRLEQLLVKTGAQLFPEAHYAQKSSQERKVLHIDTQFYNIGGHTKVALSWMENDLRSTSHLLLLDQKETLTAPINGTLHLIQEEGWLHQAKALRQFLETHYFDVIVLHQHMDDVVPTLALWDIKEATDTLVLFYSHANFRFSLGNIIAHKRLNICEGDVVISERYRYPMPDDVLYFILGDNLPEPLDATAIQAHKTTWGIEPNQTVFLTIGAAYKYTPFEDLNFFAEWNAFLMDNPEAVLVVIGCDQSDFERFCPQATKAPNLLLQGLVQDPTAYYQVADYIVDIYPLQTGLGTLNGLYYGLPPILPYRETVMVLGKEMNKLYPREVEAYLSYTTQAAYFEFIKKEIATGAYKAWAAPYIQAHIQDQFLLEPWRQQLEALYKAPVPQAPDFDPTKDVLNTSAPSQNWYNFTASPHRSVKLIALAMQYGAPLTARLLGLYWNILWNRKQLSGAGLRVLGNYLLGTYR